MPRYSTPLRYPGGKQRLAPFIAEIIKLNDGVGWAYAEPYAGGAGVAIELLLEHVVGRVYLNDSSRPVYAFWKSILTEPDAFCRRISRASLTLEAWRRHRDVVRNEQDHDILDLGFSTFVLNRCNRSGVLTAGVIGGTQQTGEWRIDARFPRNELIKRIEVIASHSSKINISNMDAERFMEKKVNKLPAETIVYCDPPYLARAKRLYLDTYQPDDHARIAKTIQSKLKRHWIVSYDAHAEIHALYKRRRRFTYDLQYSAMKAYEGSEIFVFSDNLMLPKSSTLSYVDRGLKTLKRSA